MTLLLHVHVHACAHQFNFGPFLLQSAVGWDYQASLAKHQSQTDAAKGFGGRYGVQKELQDKVCFYLSRVFLLHVHVCRVLLRKF